MPDLTCSYCRRSNLDPEEAFCPACGAPLEPPALSTPLPEPIPPPSIKALPEFEAPELWTIPPVEVPGERKKPSVLLWIGITAGGLCLLAVLCVVIFTMIAFPVRRQQSGPQSPAVEVVRPTVTARRQALIPSPTLAPALEEPDPTTIPSPTLLPAATPTPRPAGRPHIGELAPEFTLLDANSGEAVILSAFTGQPVLVHFWAIWCTYCEEEFVELQSIYETYQADGLVILAIDYEDRRSEVVAYGIDHALTFPLLLDEDGDVTDYTYRVNGFPTTFFILPDGIIASIKIGTMESAELERQLDEILIP